MDVLGDGAELNHVRAMSLGGDSTEVGDRHRFRRARRDPRVSADPSSFSAVPLPSSRASSCTSGRVAKGNQFLQRYKTVWLDEDRLDCRDERQMVVLGRGASRGSPPSRRSASRRSGRSLNPATALIFRVIGVLMVLRAKSC